MLPSDEIIGKITKLLNLAEHPSANPGEAANAAARARDLLEKYNLDLEAVRRKQGDNEGVPVTLIYYTIPGTGAVPWRRSLVNCVATVSYCRYIGTIGYPKRGKFIGQEHNIKAAMFLAETLIREIHRLALKDWNTLGSDQRARTNRYMWINSFCRGACETVTARLRADKRASETASESSTALVVVHTEAIKRYVETNISGLKDYKARPATIYKRAKANGEEAGKSIAFRRGVEAADPTRQIN